MGDRLRAIGDPVLAGRPTGVRIRTRYRSPAGVGLGDCQQRGAPTQAAAQNRPAAHTAPGTADG